MNDTQERIYRVYYCCRCKFFNLEPGERPADWSLKWRMGDCLAGEDALPVINDPRYDLIPAAPQCDDFEVGRRTKRKVVYKEKPVWGGKKG